MTVARSFTPWGDQSFGETGRRSGGPAPLIPDLAAGRAPVPSSRTPSAPVSSQAESGGAAFLSGPSVRNDAPHNRQASLRDLAARYSIPPEEEPSAEALSLIHI